MDIFIVTRRISAIITCNAPVTIVESIAPNRKPSLKIPKNASKKGKLMANALMYFKIFIILIVLNFQKILK